MATSPDRREKPVKLRTPPDDWDSIERFEQVATGHESAADAVFHRYVQRLVLLARGRMSRKLATRIDPEDVVMSAYRSFFVRARDGKFRIENSGDLWRLLVEITYHKLYRQAAHHRAAKRSMDVESSEGGVVPDRLVSKQPTPDMAALVADELEGLFARLDEVGGRVIQLRMQDHTCAEIAAEIGVSERTVQRHLSKAKALLIKDVADQDSGSKAGQERTREVATKAPPTPKSFSDYQLLQQIGVGTTGKVYRALQHSTQTECAIKYLRKEYVSDVDAVERFDREAATLSKIEHPGVIRILGHGKTPGDGRFLVMELIEGGDLQSRLNSAAIAIDQAVNWIAEACHAIGAASENAIVHCDLKPANLLLRASGEVVVTDFGFARDIRNSVAPSFAGTPAFMAPEQIDLFFGPIDERTDVYGLGMCLYALLTSRTAFEAVDPFELIGKIVSGEIPKDPRELRAEISDDLAAACLRAIAKQQVDRFQTAADFRQALRSSTC